MVSLTTAATVAATIATVTALLALDRTFNRLFFYSYGLMKVTDDGPISPDSGVSAKIMKTMRIIVITMMMMTRASNLLYLCSAMVLLLE